MATGMWTAASGAAAQSQAVDMVANNLANSDTLGFKKDAPTFKEYLTNVERDHGTVDIPRGAIKDKELYPLDGRDQSFVIVDGTYTNFKQGPLKVTQAPLDVALDGPGFLEVSTPAGIRYTRQGSLKLAQDGRLVTSDGNPVLAASPGGLAAAPLASAQQGQGGLATQGGVAAGRTPADIAAARSAASASASARFINLQDRGTNLNINQQGEIYAGTDLVGKLSVVEFQNPAVLRKNAGGLFDNGDPANAQSASNTLVHQGMIEASNVNPVEEMTNLIKANRLFEQDLKAMRTYGELLGKEANDIGKL
jgi:flagellar basal-body rod protein FlgF